MKSRINTQNKVSFRRLMPFIAYGLIIFLCELFPLRLRDWTEGNIAIVYGIAFGAIPLVVGFTGGRWMPTWARILPLLFILPAGYWWTLCSDHYFGRYLLGNTLYVLSCVVGSFLRARNQRRRFWRSFNLDWIIVAMTTIVMAVLYVPPQL